jgi:phosphate/sulfate permease
MSIEIATLVAGVLIMVGAIIAGGAIYAGLEKLADAIKNKAK